MSASGAMGPGTRVLIVVLGGLAAAGIGYLGWQALQSDAPAPDAAAVEASPEVTATPEPDAAPEPLAAPEPPAAPDPAAASETVAASDLPKIDTWRVAQDGEALVAGLAMPGAKVEAYVDDRPVAAGTAAASGEFVLQFTLPPNPAPSLLWLAMTLPGRPSVASPEMVALAPIAGPKLAATQPEPATGADEPAEKVIAEVAAPTALLVTDAGAVVLQDTAKADPMPDAQVMIDTITYAPSGAVQIGGRGAAGAGLRLYLDNSEAAEAIVPETGRWLVTLGDTAPGIYMLRVDQLDAGGKVNSRFETPFKRETLEDLALAANGPAPEPVSKTAPAAVAETAVVPTLGTATAPVEADAKAVPLAGAEPQAAPDAAPEPVSEPAPESVPGSAEISITVQPGFTLWGIAQQQMGEGVLYVQLFEANREKIKNPDLIYPGQVFSIPAATP